MGCAVSKDLAAAKTPRKASRTVHGALKRAFHPFADGILLKDRHKQVKSSDSPQRVLGRDSPKTLGEILEEETGNPEPEVINVWELMEGLEDEDAEQVDSQGTAAESLESRVGDGDHTSVTDHEEFESSSLSSPDLTARNTLLGSPISPRSPLCFDSPHKKTKRRNPSVAGLDVVVTRNFSFNLRSCMDQASTPKVILDSDSPLLKQDDQKGGKELLHRDSVDSNSDFDSELLSMFESMLEQLSRDSWLSARTSCVESGTVDIQSSRQSDVTLYFTRDDEECTTVTSILQNHGILVKKKDVSADPAWIMDQYVHVPALFIDGRYIGGAEQLLQLKERDQLHLLLDGARVARVCNGCCGACLIPCLDCNGSRRFISENGELEQCNECSEGGMVKCPLCSC